MPVLNLRMQMLRVVLSTYLNTPQKGLRIQDGNVFIKASNILHCCVNYPICVWFKS